MQTGRLGRGWINPTFVVFGICFSSFWIVIAGALIWRDYWQLWSIPVLIVQTLLVILLFTVLHDSVHRCASKQRWLNDFMLHSLWPIFLNAPSIFKKIHLSHHAYTNQGSKDPDHFTSSRSLLGRWIRSMVLILYYYVYAFKNYNANRRALMWMGLSLLIPMAALLLALFHPMGLILSLCWFVPSFLGIGILGFINTAWPHHPGKETSKYLNTKILLVPRWLQYLMLNQNLHLIHHLRPTVPWYDYPSLYEALRPQLLAEGALEEDYRKIRTGVEKLDIARVIR